mmetsp:Transcript_70249/g.198265  ORF Transcript_70249/g.198265 Transcript_70249/m.198265 type:complete len:206 (-) Transcript_70249:1474-2091(-)
MAAQCSSQLFLSSSQLALLSTASMAFWQRFSSWLASHSCSRPAYVITAFTASTRSCSPAASLSARSDGERVDRTLPTEGCEDGEAIFSSVGVEARSFPRSIAWALSLCLFSILWFSLHLASMASQSHMSFSFLSVCSSWPFFLPIFLIIMDFTRVIIDVVCRSIFPSLCSSSLTLFSSSMTPFRSVGFVLRFLLSSSMSGSPRLT